MNEDLEMIYDVAEEAMSDSIEHLKKELTKIRAGKASPAMVELIVNEKAQIEHIEKNPKEQAFIATLKDKRRFVGMTDKETFFKVVEAHGNLKDKKSSPAAIPTTG